jgi:succinate dehydrogenase/fumarate reductase cytochrome b subunit
VTPSLSSWARLQRVSGLLALAFLGLHAANVAASVVDPEVFDGVLDAFRNLYRPSEFVEALVVWMPIATHLIASGAVMAERRQAGDLDPSRFWLRLSGWFLLVAMGLHVFVARFMGSQLEHGGGVSYLAFGIENWPAWTVAYYLVLIVVAAWHVGVGAAIALSDLGLLRQEAPRLAMTGTVWSVILGVVLVAGAGRIVLSARDLNPTFYPSYQRTFDRFMPFMHAHNPRAN